MLNHHETGTNAARKQKSILVDVDSWQVIRTFDRIELGEQLFNENMLQEVLAASPGVLPFDEFGSIFSPAVCIGREIINTDLLFISPAGFITIVETKLWRNPGARRTAVAQSLDYAKKLSGWTYQQLQEAVQRRLGFSESLYDWLCATEETSEGMPSEQVFYDSVSRSLSAGHFLLLIVGDGIREGIGELTESLNQAPHLGFTFGLVELVCYRWENGKLLLSPAVIARTKEIERAIVRIEMKPATKSQVDASVTTSVDDIPTTPGLQAFMETLAERSGSRVAQEMESFSRQLVSESDDIEIVCNQRYLIKCCYSEIDRDKSLWIFTVTKTGKVALGAQEHWKGGTAEVRQIIVAFWDAVAQYIPELRPQRLAKGTMSRPTCSLTEFLGQRQNLQPVFLEYVQALHSLDP